MGARFWHMLLMRIADDSRRSSIVRTHHGKKKAPTAAIVDSQSVKTANHGGVRGYDAGKRVLSRKSYLLVDSLGLILLVAVHSANIQDRDCAKILLQLLIERFGWLKLVICEKTCWVASHELQHKRRIRLEIVRRSDENKGYQDTSKTLDRGEDLRLAFKIQKNVQRLWDHC
jgi:putative transposase